MKIRYLKLACNTFENASRNMREIAVAKELGADIFILAKQADCSATDTLLQSKGYHVERMTTRPLGQNKYLKGLNHLLTIFLWSKKAKKLNADVISCHDIFALFIGYMSTWFIPLKRKAYLIYDSHEYEEGRNQKRNRVVKALIRRMEKFLIKKAALSVMVNDTIADAVIRLHGLGERPLVVRNITNYWESDLNVIAQTRKSLCSTMNVSENTFLIMYHGMVSPNRGIEKVIHLISDNSETAGIILGDTLHDTYLDELKSLAKAEGLSNRILFHPAVPADMLWKYVGAADIGTILFSSKPESHKYLLPNKFFENIQAMTPIVSGKYPEIRKIIEEDQIGFVCDEDDMETISNYIRHLQTDREYYNQLKKNLKKSKERYCWENEKQVLYNALQNLFSKVIQKRRDH